MPNIIVKKHKAVFLPAGDAKELRLLDAGVDQPEKGFPINPENYQDAELEDNPEFAMIAKVAREVQAFNDEEASKAALKYDSGQEFFIEKRYIQ